MSSFKKVVKPFVGNISQEEMDLLLVAMAKVLESEAGGAPVRGSIVMYEQRRGEDEECVFALNMEDGEVNDYPCEDGKTAPSAYMADQAIRELAKWPEEGAFKSGTNAGTRLEFGQLRTGLYYGHDDYSAMSLNTTLGRFLISSYVDFVVEGPKELKSKNELFLVAVADIIRRLRPKDRALYYSVKEMLELYLCAHSDRESYLEEKVSIIRQMFSDGDLPELKVWRKWREEQRAKDELEVFFDYDPDEDCDEFFREYFGAYKDEENYENDYGDYDDDSGEYDADDGWEECFEEFEDE